MSKPAPMLKVLLYLNLLFFFSSCFFGGPKNTGRVTGFSKGSIHTQFGGYFVGALDSSWQKKSYKKSVITFVNTENHASISTQSFCSQSYSDVALKYLMKDLFIGLENSHTLRKESFILDGREALKWIQEGLLDGVKVRIDAVSVKKNNCLIDFYLVSPEKDYPKAQEDFTVFYSAFHFLGDPQ